MPAQSFLVLDPVRHMTILFCLTTLTLGVPFGEHSFISNLGFECSVNCYISSSAAVFRNTALLALSITV
jgi:hypothetical protein